MSANKGKDGMELRESTPEQARGSPCSRCRTQAAVGVIFLVQLWHQGSVSHRSLYDDSSFSSARRRSEHGQLIQGKGVSRNAQRREPPAKFYLQDIQQAVYISDTPPKSSATRDSASLRRFESGQPFQIAVKPCHRP